MSKIIEIQAIIAKLEIETNQLLADIMNQHYRSDVLELSDLFLRLTGKNSILEKIEKTKEQILNEQAENIKLGDTFRIGLREFQKVEAFENAKLNLIELSKDIQDQDQLKEFFKEIPKSQKEVEILLKQFGFTGNADQFYSKESKGTFKIKVKN